MKTKLNQTLLIILCALGIVGCAGKLTAPPPLQSASRIAIAPFLAAPEAPQLGGQVPYTLGVRFSLALKGTEWLYKQSETINPVGAELQKLQLTPTEIFRDPALAAKVGEALDTDFIIVGQAGKPTLKTRRYNQPVKRQGRQVGISGTARYIRILQTATVDIEIKTIETKSAQVIFDDKIKGYIKYWFAFETQQRGMVNLKDEQRVLADLSTHAAGRVAHALYPEGMPEVQLGEVLERPNVLLLGPGGPVKFD